MSSAARGEDRTTRGSAIVPKLIIVGFDLLSQSGHDFNELYGYKAAAEALRLQCTILLPRTSSCDLVARLSAKQTLGPLPFGQISPSHEIDELVAFADTRGFESYVRAFDAEQPSATDMLLFTRPNATAVRGIGRWLANRPPEQQPAVFFRFLGDVVSDPPTGAYNSLAPIFRLACTDLRRYPGQERVYFLGENAAIQRAVSRVCRRRTFAMPMPKFLGDVEAPGTRTASSPALIYLSLNHRCGGLEHRAPDIIRSVRALQPEVKFIAKFSAEVKDARNALEKARIPGVELPPIAESVGDYLGNLARATIIVLPYPAATYRILTSGVFVEAVNLGKPVVAPSGTWMSDEITAGRGVGMLFHELTVEAVVAAIAEALQSLDRLLPNAVAIGPRLRANNSCNHAVELMLEMAQVTPDMEPRYSIGSEINLREPLDSRTFMRGDWGHTEDWGVWTTGRSVGLSLRLDEPRPKSSLVLRALVRPFLPGTHPRLGVTVSSDGQPVGEWLFDLRNPEPTTMRWCEAHIPTPAYCAEPVEITFTIDSPRSPVQAGMSNDARMLGLGFQKIVIAAAS